MAGPRSAMFARFWLAALSWLPVAVMVHLAISVLPGTGAVDPPFLLPLVWFAILGAALLLFAPMGLPGAMLCRELWRLGFPRVAWAIGAAMFVATLVLRFLYGEMVDALAFQPIGRLVLALEVYPRMLPVWIVVFPAIAGLVIWVSASAMGRAPTDAQTRTPKGRGSGISARRFGFWVLALVWFPAVVIASILAGSWSAWTIAYPADREFLLPPALTLIPMGEVQLWVRFLPIFATALLVFSPAGLMIGLLCRQIRRRGYRRAAWAVAAAVAIPTAILSLVATQGSTPVLPPDLLIGAHRIVQSLDATTHFMPVHVAMPVAAFSILLWVAVASIKRFRNARNEGLGALGDA